jgi:hypothetical protein
MHSSLKYGDCPSSAFLMLKSLLAFINTYLKRALLFFLPGLDFEISEIRL